MTLGEKLQLLRRSRGLSQEQLAAELDVSRQAISKWECGDSTPDLDKLRAICTYFGVTTDYLIWERAEDAPQAAEQKQGGDTRGRSGVFNDALLLAMTIVVMTAVWSVARMGFESYTALHFVLGAMAIAAAVLACTVWKKRGRPICFGVAAAGAALAIARLASMLGYLVDLWSTSREYADGGETGSKATCHITCSILS